MSCVTFSCECPVFIVRSCDRLSFSQALLHRGDCLLGPALFPHLLESRSFPLGNLFHEPEILSLKHSCGRLRFLFYRRRFCCCTSCERAPTPLPFDHGTTGASWAWHRRILETSDPFLDLPDLAHEIGQIATKVGSRELRLGLQRLATVPGSTNRSKPERMPTNCCA